MTAKQQLFQAEAREDDLVLALQDCQAIIDSGQELDREKVLEKYPHLKEELAACLEGLMLIDQFQARDPSTRTGHPKFATCDQLAPSSTLGDFLLKREIGRGGMGVVYEAEQLSVGRRVAVKVLPYAAMLDKRQVARFQNEARAAATLEHPHIVPVYFVGNDRGVYYYAMRLIDGKNLSEILRDLSDERDSSNTAPNQDIQQTHLNAPGANSTSPSHRINSEYNLSGGKSDSRTISNSGAPRKSYFDSIGKIAMQAATALDFAHTHGIVHRDVKPANIMLDDLGDAWVTDFGLARIETDSDVTVTGDLLGTLRYMSPEQTLAKRAVVDQRTDVYSLGATLYELLTLKPAFDGQDRVGLLKQIASEEPKPPTRIDARIPQDLEIIALKALQKRPEDRYSDAQEMAEDLQRFLNRLPIQARRTSLTRRFKMWRTRHPLAVVTIGLAVAVLSILAVGTPFLWMQHAAREQAEQLASQAQSLADASAARAATQAYFASISEVRELNAIRPVGWTWDALERIKRVATLDADGKDLLQLRSLAANALIATDVQLIQEFAKGVDPGAVACSRDGGLFAIGEVRPAPNADVARIYIYQVAATQDRVSLARTLQLPTEGGWLGKIVQRVSGGPEGIRSLCFSHQANRLAVGTRYGQILEWDLDKDEAPIEVSGAKSHENERVTVLKYSPDDRHLVACIGGLDVLRIIDLTKSEYAVWDCPRKRDSFALSESGILLFQNSNGSLVEINDLANPNPREKATERPATHTNGLAANQEGTCGVVGDWTSLGPIVSFLDLQCLQNAMRIDIATSTAESAYSRLEFGPADQSIIGLKNGNQIRVWDGLSGFQLFDLPRSDTTYAKHAATDFTGLWTISGSPGSQLYHWRNPSRLADAKGRKREAPSVLQTFAPGAWPIEAFDLSRDGEQIVLVESHAARRHQVRVRSFALHNGEEDGRWTLCGNVKGSGPLRSRGTDVLYAHGGNIIAACEEVGIPMVLGKSGIQFPAETARPMVTAQGRADENGKITFDFPIPPPISKPYEDLVVGVSFRLTQGRRESLRVDAQAIRMEIFVDGKSTIARQLSVEPLLTIGADGWQSQLIASLNETTKRVRLEVSLPKAVASDSFTIETGSAYLMATLGDHAAHYWLGPYATQGNGKIVAANDGNTLTSRDTPRSVSNWKWTDTLNEFATIRAIDAAENSAVWGTRWGHVYLVDARGDVRQLNSLGRSHGGDVKEEVTSVAIDRRGNLAASGNLDGKVTLFDLTSTAANLNEVQIQAHSDAVSCVALNREGKILATAAENSKLKLWYIEGQESVLWCELTLGNPIKDMQFSPATAKLFILCRRERGIRVLDLEALKDEFEKLSINESFLPSPLSRLNALQILN